MSKGFSFGQGKTSPVAAANVAQVVAAVLAGPLKIDQSFGAAGCTPVVGVTSGLMTTGGLRSFLRSSSGPAEGVTRGSTLIGACSPWQPYAAISAADRPRVQSRFCLAKLAITVPLRSKSSVYSVLNFVAPHRAFNQAKGVPNALKPNEGGTELQPPSDAPAWSGQSRDSPSKKVEVKVYGDDGGDAEVTRDIRHTNAKSKSPEP
jgi:hypothetical protein